MSQEKPRLLVLTSTFPRWPGDRIPRFVFDLCAALAPDFAITVLAPHAKGAATLEHDAGLRIVRYRYAPERLEVLAYDQSMLDGLRGNPLRFLLVPALLLAQLIATIRLLRRESFNCVHAHWVVPQGLVAVVARSLTRSSARILCTSHGSDLNALRGRIFHIIKRAALRRCDVLSVVSASMRETALSICPDIANRTVIAPMGADLVGKFTPGVNRVTGCTLLFVGRLSLSKGLAVLLEAIPIIRQAHDSVRLRVVGNGPQAETLQDQALSLGIQDCVEWLGPLTHDQLVCEYRNATALIFPSLPAGQGDGEGLGLVPVEAIGCGCPVIASDLPGVTDVIKNGVTGMTVPAGNVGALATMVLRLLADVAWRQRLSDHARQFVLQRYDWTVVAERYKRLITGCDRTMSSFHNVQ